MSRDIEAPAAAQVASTRPRAKFDKKPPSFEAPGAPAPAYHPRLDRRRIRSRRRVLRHPGRTLRHLFPRNQAGARRNVHRRRPGGLRRGHQRVGAQVLFWVTTMAYAALINVYAFVWVVTAVLVVVGAAVLAALAIATVIGFESPLRLFLRWGVVIALVTVSVYASDPDFPWFGLGAGFLLAVAIETTIKNALRRRYVPGAALAACLVAGGSAVALLVVYAHLRFVQWHLFAGVIVGVLLVTYVVVRLVLRLTAVGVSGAADAAASS